MMAIIGWLVCVCLGGYFTYAAVMGLIFVYGISEQIGWYLFAPLSLGIALLIFAWFNMPFTLTMR